MVECGIVAGHFLGRCSQMSPHTTQALTIDHRNSSAQVQLGELWVYSGYPQKLGWGVTYWSTGDSKVSQESSSGMGDHSRQLHPCSSCTPGRHLHPRLLSPPRVYSFYSLREGPCEASNFMCLLSLVSFINFLSLLSSRRECFNLKETAKDLVLDQGDVTLDSMSWSTRKEGKKE